MRTKFPRIRSVAAALGLMLSLVLLVTGCAGARQARQERHIQQAAAILQTRSDADSLAAAGLLRYWMSHDDALLLLSRATAAAPGRPDLMWLQLQLCGLNPSCDTAPLILRLRALDPANGAAWLGDLSRARQAKDDVAMDAALIALAGTERVDIYWTSLIGHLSGAVAETGQLPLFAAMITMTGLVSAIAIPPFNPASSACQGDRLQRAGMIEACRGISLALENGDTDIAEMSGVAIAKRVWPEESPERRAGVERRRAYGYRSAAWAPISNAMPGSPAKTARYVALCVETRREQDVVRVQLIDAGKNPDPPGT